jgi:hypothetical protein
LSLTANTLAVVAAGLYAAGADLQQAEARQTEATSVGLWGVVVRQPRWWLGIGTNGLGMGVQAGALHYGALAAVQPLLTLSVLFCLPLAVRRDRVPLQAREVLGALTLVGGLWLLVATVHAAPVAAAVSPSWWAPGLAVGSVAAVCAVAARGRFSASLRGIAAGLLCGLGATYLKLAVDGVSHGLAYVLTTWPVYGFALATAAGFVLLQRAFQQGSVVASFPALIALDPLTSSCLGLWLLGETVQPAWLGLLGAVVTLMGLGLLCTSRRVLERRSGRSST